MKKIVCLLAFGLLSAACGSAEKKSQEIKIGSLQTTNLVYTGTIEGDEESTQKQFEVTTLMACVESYCSGVYSVAGTSGVTDGRFTYPHTTLGAIIFLFDS